MKWKVAVLLLMLALATSLAINWRKSQRPELPAVVLQVRQLKQLVTVRYSIQRIVALTEAKSPVGSESILLMVQGEALGGVDLGALTQKDLNFDTASSHKVMIRLPEPHISDVFLDEKQTRVWDRHVTWWTPWVPFDPSLETRARLKAVDDIRTAALQMGILDQARRNAQIAIRDLLSAFQTQVAFAGEHT